MKLISTGREVVNKIYSNWKEYTQLQLLKENADYGRKFHMTGAILSHLFCQT